MCTARKTDSIFWEGVKVGVVSNPKVDHFDYYGSWWPTSDVGLYRRFLAQVEAEGGARVDIGEIGSVLKGEVALEPNDEIEIKIRPSS